MATQLLTQQAYNKFKSFKSITDSEIYYHLYSKATDVLLNVTHRYFEKNEFNNTTPDRQLAYLKALACQIEYFYETGETTTTGLNTTPQVMDLGRTKVSMMAHVNEEGTVIPKSIICPDIYLYLEGFDFTRGSDESCHLE